MTRRFLIIAVATAVVERERRERARVALEGEVYLIFNIIVVSIGLDFAVRATQMCPAPALVAANRSTCDLHVTHGFLTQRGFPLDERAEGFFAFPTLGPG